MKTEIEYIVYHRVKRVFIPILDIESENSEDIEVYEFDGQNFKLIAKRVKLVFEEFGHFVCYSHISVIFNYSRQEISFNQYFVSHIWNTFA